MICLYPLLLFKQQPRLLKPRQAATIVCCLRFSPHTFFSISFLTPPFFFPFSLASPLPNSFGHSPHTLLLFLPFVFLSFLSFLSNFTSSFYSLHPSFYLIPMSPLSLYPVHSLLISPSRIFSYFLLPSFSLPSTFSSHLSHSFLLGLILFLSPLHILLSSLPHSFSHSSHHFPSPLHILLSSSFFFSLSISRPLIPLLPSPFTLQSSLFPPRCKKLAPSLLPAPSIWQHDLWNSHYPLLGWI